MVLTKEKLIAYWENDFILHSLVIAHSVFWRGSRKDIKNKEELEKFLVRHSLAHSNSGLEEFIKLYAAHGILNTPNHFSEETGFINPDAYDLISKLLMEDYNLETSININYNFLDFLWDIYHNQAGTEDRLVQTFEKLFKDSFGFQAQILALGSGKNKHEYLRLIWKENNKESSWWIGFLTGSYSKREDQVAEGLINAAALNMNLLQSSLGKDTLSYISVCGLEFGDIALGVSAHIMDSYGINFSLVQLYSLIKFIKWGTGNDMKYKKEMQNHFTALFEGQDPERPLSIALGISQLMKVMRKE